MAWFRKARYTTLSTPSNRHRIPEGLWRKCPNCLEMVTQKDWDEGHKVCPKCRHHEPLSARERIGQLLDEDSFTEYDSNLISGDPLGFVDSKPYRDRIRDARKKTGEREAVVGGLGQIKGRAVSIAVMDFRFNGGSMGSVVGEKITRSMERGLEQGLPVINVCASGGARMQEGMFSLMQMAKTSAMVARLHEAGIPYIIVMGHPTTAGVLASFASLGDVIIAEPDALIGFAGPRVIEQTIKQILPPGFQKSEFVQEHGFVDMIVTRAELKGRLATLIDLLASPIELTAIKESSGKGADRGTHRKSPTPSAEIIEQVNASQTL